MVQEPCAVTLKVLQNEILLRKNLFQSIHAQLDFVHHHPSIYIEEDDIYYLTKVSALIERS
jgi:hypothetical protein